jgi:hypothetical protein
LGFDAGVFPVRAGDRVELEAEREVLGEFLGDLR